MSCLVKGVKKKKKEVSKVKFERCWDKANTSRLKCDYAFTQHCWRCGHHRDQVIMNEGTVEQLRSHMWLNKTMKDWTVLSVFLFPPPTLDGTLLHVTAVTPHTSTHSGASSAPQPQHEASATAHLKSVSLEDFYMGMQSFWLVENCANVNLTLRWLYIQDVRWVNRYQNDSLVYI